MQGNGELESEERKREFFLISGCVRNGVQELFFPFFFFLDKLPLKWRKCSKAKVESSVGRCLGCLPSSQQRGLGGGP